MDKGTAKLKEPGTALFIVAVFGSILYISLIFNDNLWVDEAFTASLIRQDMASVIRDTVKDTLPPFYNVFGKILTLIFGFSPYVLKFFSCFPLILLIFFGGRKLNSVYGFTAALFYELFLIAMPYFLHYATEIRMYSWGMFSAGMAGAYFAEILEEKKGSGGLIAFTVFSAFIHHYALIACGFLWLFLLILTGIKKDREEIRAFLLRLLILFLLCLPSLILSAYQIKNASSYFKMAPLSLKSLLSDIRSPFVTNITPLSALLLVSVLLLVLFSLKFSPSLSGVLLISVFFLTILFGYGVSFLAGKSLFTARYLSPSLSVFWMGAAVLLERMISLRPGRKVLPYALALTLLTGSFMYMQSFREEYKSGVSSMKAFFAENVHEGDLYVIKEDVPEIEICFKYYFPGLIKTDPDKIPETAGKIWFVEVPGKENELENCRKRGYNPIYKGDYSFDRYSFSLYELERM